MLSTTIVDQNLSAQSQIRLAHCQKITKGILQEEVPIDIEMIVSHKVKCCHKQNRTVDCTEQYTTDYLWYLNVSINF